MHDVDVNDVLVHRKTITSIDGDDDARFVVGAMMSSNIE